MTASLGPVAGPPGVLTERGPRPTAGEQSDQVRVAEAGGLASSVERALRAWEGPRPVRWLWLAADDAGPPPTGPDGGWTGIPVPRSPGTYPGFYHAFGAGLLWPVLHGIPPGRGAGTASWDDYREVNAAAAAAVVRTAPTGPLLVQDYQFLLVPGLIRSAQPERAVALHVHTAFPDERGWRELGDPAIGDLLLRGMLAADLVSFSSDRWARNFERCALGLPGVRPIAGGVLAPGRASPVHIATLPVLSPPAVLAEAGRAPEVARWRAALGDLRRTVVVISRVDPAKNLPVTLDAIDQVLEEAGDVEALVLLVPSSRQHLPAYARCAEKTAAAMDALRRNHPGRIAVHEGNDAARALAALRDCAALVVGSIADGMNLVVQEAVWLTEADAALVLSARTGAADLLAPSAEIVDDPTDAAKMAKALLTALALPPGERPARIREARAALASAAAHGSWLSRQEGWLTQQKREERE